MPDGRRDGHGLVRFDKLPEYFVGMLTETAYVLALTLVAVLIAVLTLAVLR